MARYDRQSFIPAGAVKVASKSSSAVAYVCEITGTVGARFYAVGFIGKAGKPAFNYSFKSAERRAEWVAQWFKSQDSAAASKASRASVKKAQRAAGHQLAVGDVLRSSWGYDQTNIDYYEVTALVGKRMVEIRELAQETEETQFMQGKCVPVKGSYLGEAMRKVVSTAGDSVRIASYASAFKVEPVKVGGVAIGYGPSHWTAYA